MFKRAQKKANEFVGAAERGYFDTLKKLKAEGVDVNVKDDYGGMALPEALRRDYYDIALWLMENGADVHLDNTAGILEGSVREARDSYYDSEGLYKVVKAATAKGLIIKGMAYYAIQHDDLDLLKRAIDNGSDTLQALVNAAYKGSEDAAIFLLEEKKVEVTQEVVEAARESGNQDLAELVGMMFDPEDAKAWKAEREKVTERERIMREGTIEEKAALMLQEQQDQVIEARRQKDERLAEIKTTVEEIEKGLGVMAQSLDMGFSFETTLDEEAEKAEIKTNVEAKKGPITIEVFNKNQQGLHITANTAWEASGGGGYSKKFNDASGVVAEVIKRAVATNFKPPRSQAPKP